MGKRLLALTVAALAASAACTTQQTSVPALAGPSAAALSITMTAIPDSISQDGASQSAIALTAFDASGKPMPGLPLRMEMAVDAGPGCAQLVPHLDVVLCLQDFGTLSARTIVTDSTGTARTVYTAPPPPPSGVGGSGTMVTILGTPTGSNFQTVNSSLVTIRLVPPGVILPAAGTPTAAFTYSPQPVNVNVAVTFDGSASSPGTNATQITSYAWNFGDGSTATGKTSSHTFTSAGAFNVTLTVTNDRGLSASSTQVVGAALSSGPIANFVFSPAAPQVGQSIVFNAATSASAPGRTLTSFSWNFGDGATASGVTTSHTFAAVGTFSVTLSVADDTGQKGTAAVPVAIAAAGGGAVNAPTATFTFSPAAPGVNDAVFFNASASAAGAGHTIASYAWTFGDGATGAGVTVTHAYSASGSYSVQLRVTDDAGQSTTSAPTSLSIGSPPAPTSSFTFSPALPGRFDEVVFDASTSTTAQGQTIVDVAWNFGDGTAVVHCPGNAACVNVGVTNRISAHTFQTATSFVVNLVVTDSAGRTGSSNKTVIVDLGLPKVVVTASPSSPNPGVVVNFNSDGTTYFSGSNPPSFPVSFAWTFGDGAVSSLPDPSHSYGAIGAYTAGLSVTDNKGRTGVSTVTVTVVAVVPPVPPAPPVASFVFGPPSPKANVTNVQFDGSGSTGSSLTYTWNFGDGSLPVAAGAIVNHVYAAAGPYSVTLRVTDGVTGLSNTSAAQTVTVVP